MRNVTNEVIVTRRGQIATITLNRPEKMNTITPTLVRSLKSALDELRDDRNLRCLILTGAGSRAFSAGFDISMFPDPESYAIDPEAAQGRPDRLIDEAVLALEAFPTPVIAMIRGYAVGGGCELAIGCDLRVASTDARLGITPAKLGLVYRPEGIWRFLNLVGPSRSRELFFTAGQVDAARALEIGLVDQVVAPNLLAEVTYDLAEKICENAPLAVQGMKKVINYCLGRPPLEGPNLAEVEAIVQRSYESADCAEGRRAFVEKRKPEFEGR